MGGIWELGEDGEGAEDVGEDVVSLGRARSGRAGGQQGPVAEMPEKDE